MFTAIKRIVVAGWQHFVRNTGLSVATIFIIATMVFLIANLFLIKGVADYIMESLQEKMDISVYFDQAVLESDILAIQNDISNLNGIKEVVYVSKEEALSRFTARYKDNKVVVEALTEVGNPLMASLNIRATEAGKYGDIVDFFKAERFKGVVSKIDYYERQPVIRKVSSLVAEINRIGLAATIIIAIFAVLITFNTVRLAIYDSRSEIGIMRLVGATNLFIHGPFIIQGAIAGFFAFAISIILITFSVYLISPRTEAILTGFSLFSYLSANFELVFIIQLLCGIGLGVFSSIIAVRKYLKV